MKTGQTLKVLFIAALLVAISSCNFTKGKAQGESAVAQFHKQFNDGQFHDIYIQADEDFKKAADEASFVELLEAVRRKLGTVKQAKPLVWNVNVTTSGTLVRLSYDVEFTEGQATEEFVFRVSGNKAMLYNYNVNSPLLITK